LERESGKYTYQIGFNTTAPKEREFDDVPDSVDTRSTTYLVEDIKFHYALWRRSGFVVI
jgi:hypothetical protein